MKVSRIALLVAAAAVLEFFMTVALDLRRRLLSSAALFSPGETVRIRVRPGVARLLAEEDPRILEETEATLGIRVELTADEALESEGFEIDRG